MNIQDVNSFVAEADSIKHSNTANSCLNNNTAFLHPHHHHHHGHNHFSSSDSTTNEEDSEEDDYSDSENELRWPAMLNTSYSTPTTTNATSNTTSNKQKLMIKIKKSSSLNNSALPSPYGDWNDFISPKSSKSTSTANSYRANPKYSRKSMSNIFNMTTHQHGTTTKKKSNKLLDNSKRRGSAPHRLTLNHNHSSSSLGSLHSSSSLTSLSNNLQQAMRVSDTNSFLSEDEEDVDEEGEDDEDDEYQIRQNQPNQLPTKKGRNVDKACNHCKRSHLRCDDMRPCRRCVATGKTGCKDVQHKPRGRPKLHKK